MTACCQREWRGVGFAPFCCWQLQDWHRPVARCPACAEHTTTELLCTACNKPLTFIRAHAYLRGDDGKDTPVPSWHVAHPLPECKAWLGPLRWTCVPEPPYGTTLDSFVKVGAS